ncbi:hypothetical protein OHI65_07245 [Brucella sp. MAB-22]|uniref:hypothetical protein n=1 Tax=Brucella sp. MAB-22 TaxID=2986424 RepID=UPI00221F677E|nr:hypothetical protein [Brucella sp. MAB-22]UYT54168.1 hypothetical protein OHI65_07245 [Brucella sp. MAB-22]
MQYKFIKFGPEGYPLFYYDEVTYPPTEKGKLNPAIPADAVAVTDEQWLRASIMQLWRAPDGQLVEPPPPEPIIQPEPVTILPAVTLWERMTEAEADQVNAAMATQPFRTRQIFLTANTFRSDHELWPLLVQMATDLFGDDRAAELLAG